MKKNSVNRGFSLIEILIAVALLGGAIVLIVGLIPSGYIAAVKAGRQSTINHLAYDKIDELKQIASTDWGNAELSVGNHPTILTNEMMVTVQMDPDNPEFDGYSLEWNVANGPQTRQVSAPGSWEADSEIKLLTVTVAWKKYQQNGTLNSPAPSDQMIRVFHTVLASNR